MSFVINTNISNHLSTQHLNNYSRNMDSAIASLSSGTKINAAGDFSEGEAIANRFLVQSSALNTSLSTMKSGLSLADNAEKALSNSEAMLQEMRELAIKSSNGTYLPRTGKALYSKATASFRVTGGSDGTRASGTIALTNATEGSNASGSLSFSGASSGANANAVLRINDAVDGVQASGTIQITGGSSPAGNTIDTITLDGVNILSSAVNHTGNNSTTAAAVASNISISGYSVSRVGSTITLRSDTKDETQNGTALAITTSGNFTANNSNTLSGGVDASETSITGLTIDGANALSGAPLSVTGGTSAIATAIKNAFSHSDYSASVSSNRITITSNTKNTSQNGGAINLSMSNSAGATATSNESGLALAGGYTATTSTISNFSVNGGSNLINGSGSVTVVGGNSDIATAVAARLSSSDYNFYASGGSINVVSTSKLASQNGFAIAGSISHGGGASTASMGSGTLSNGDDTSTNTISAITVNGVNILAGNVAHNGGNSGTATAIKNAINVNSANSGYQAENSGTSTITITATDKDTTDNGYVIAMTRLNNGVALNEVTQGSTTNMTGGLTPITNAFTNISVNGQKINTNVIAHGGNNTTAAAAIAADINATNSGPRNYTATSTGDTVNIFSDTIAYWEDNDKSITVQTQGDATHNNDNSSAIMDGSVRLDGGAVVYINNEIKDIIKEVDDQLLNAKHNHQNLFSGNSLAFYTGTNSENSITAPIYTYAALNTDTLDLTVNAAQTSIAYLDTKIDEVRNVQSQYVAFSNRIEHQIDYIADAMLQNTQTISNIMDADMALETSQLVKYQFLEDAALSMYLQTRTQKRDVIKLYFDQSKVEGQGRFYF